MPDVEETTPETEPTTNTQPEEVGTMPEVEKPEEDEGEDAREADTLPITGLNPTSMVLAGSGVSLISAGSILVVKDKKK